MMAAAWRLSRSLPDPSTRADSTIRPLPVLASADSHSDADSSEWQELSSNGPTTAVLTLRGVAQLAPFGALIMVPILISNLTPSASSCLCLLFATAGTILPGLCLGELMSGLPWVGTNGAGALCTLVRPIIGEIPALLVGWGLIGDLVIRSALVAKAAGRLLDRQLSEAVGRYIAVHGFNSSEYSLTGQAPVSALSGPDLLGMLFAVLLVCLFAALLALGLATRLSFFLTCVFAAGFVVIACTAFFHSSSGVHGSTGTMTHAAFFHGSMATAPLRNTSTHPLPILPSPTAMLHATSVALAGYSVFDGSTASSAFDGSSEMVKVGLLTPAHVLPVSTFLAVALNAMIFTLSVLGLSGGSAGNSLHLPGVAFASLAAFQNRTWLRTFACVISVAGLVASFVATLDTLVHLLSALAIEGVLPRQMRSLTINIILGACTVSLLSLIVSDVALLEMAAAGTALSLIAAPVCLLLLHYLPTSSLLRLLSWDGGTGDYTSDSSGFGITDSEATFQLRPALRHCPPLSRLLAGQPRALVVIFLVDGVAIILCAFLSSVYGVGSLGTTWPALIFLAVVILVSSILIGCYQPVTVRRMGSAFSVPLVPVFPILAVAISVYMAINLPWITWVRMLIFSSFGVVIYSTERLWKYFQETETHN